MTTKSERIVAEAAELFERDEIRQAIHKLTGYADRGVNNQRTAVIFNDAIDREFARFEEADNGDQ